MQILKLNWKNFKEIVKITTQSIKEGKVIVCPTDTVYGLICDATNKKAVTKIFKIKKRPKKKPTPIFVKDMDMAKKFAEIDKNQEKFLKKNWPGKVTIVLKRKKNKLRIYGIDKKTIALRIPNYKLINGLFAKLNIPLAETSVNISGKPAMVKIEEIINCFNRARIKPDLIINIGDLKFSRPSIVIDLTIQPPKVLRQ